MTNDPDRNDQGALLTAFGRLLRPLLRVFVRRGITLPQVYRALKVLYVQAAERDLGAEGAPVTDSRIALVTGVHRRDVRRIRSEPEEAAAATRLTLLATVIGRWLSGPETVGADGAPLPLPRTAAEGPSFDGLVSAISRDLRPRTVLDEMLRQGLVTADDPGTTITLAPDALAGSADQDQKLHFFATNIGDHMAAAAENLDTTPPPNFERAVFYNNLSKSSVAELDALSRALGQELLLTLNREARSRQSDDATDDTATRRFRLGVYVYQEDEGDDRSD